MICKIYYTATQLQYQHPPACPAYHVPRLELLKEISSVILNSDITPTMGTTVTIRGIGGIGKSTIAKALCHDPLIKKHFINGFLWISLTPPIPSLTTILSEIYEKLSDKSATTNVSILISKIKSLVCSPSCKLLVIFDDVWEAKDAMVLVDVFSNCKTILTTRKMNVDAKIPSIRYFEIKPMSISESVKLLTLQIVEVKTLHDTDVSRIEELAKDLHCWPLLLNLVHYQLYYEWNKSPQDAISKVQQKLFDNGLTAFDPENQLEASRDNAVRASITASLKLLTKKEEMILFYIASSIIGFGIYTIKDVLSAALQMDPKQFDKYTRNLWCHGLISFQDVTIPSVNTKIPCIGIHEVIAHYINENMPNEFYFNIATKTIPIFRDVFYRKYFSTDVAENVGKLFLSRTDAIVIPHWIRILIIFTKFMQRSFYDFVNMLVEQNIQLLQSSILDRFIYNNQFPSLKHTHKIIEQDCKSIRSQLANGTWTKQYFDNHPCKTTVDAMITNLNTLLNSSEYNFNHKDTLFIQEYVFKKFNGHVVCFNKTLKTVMHKINGFSHVLCLVNAAASDNDINHYLICSALYI